MEHINRIELRGKVGTVRPNEYNGAKVANFSLVTEILYKAKDGTPTADTTWHNIVAWEGRDIKDLDKIVKGAAVHLTGRLRENRYTSAEGVEKQFYEVLANKVRVLTPEEMNV